ncbi:alpha/beta fold hydrolase [Corallincola platygyrae]|uniref:Alpha/beta fold hydrolase n=1 Tax=Corallincola platygyrae TaxID=1193278 RepID=A0ABW4XL17_9GAMM
MQLHFQRRGHGPTVVLIHGLFGNMDNLGTLARHLEPQFDVLSVDLINHGRSAHIAHTDYTDMAGDIIETLDALNIERAHFVGHSMGGKVSMEVAMQRPELIDKLVVADIAPVQYQSHHVLVLKGLAELNEALPVATRKQADEILARHLTDLGVRQFLLKNLTKTEIGFQWQFNYQGILNSYEDILKPTSAAVPFNSPTLFIKGSESEYILTEHREAIALRFPNAKAKVIQGTGHWLHAEKPGIFNRMVSQFLTS